MFKTIKLNHKNDLERSKKIYFTIISNKDGFGDFFDNWINLYNLMTYLGFVYIHTPIQLDKKHTTNNSSEIEKIVGFDFFKNNIKDYGDFEQCSINFPKFIHILTKPNALKNIFRYINSITKDDRCIILIKLNRDSKFLILNKVIKSRCWRFFIKEKVPNWRFFIKENIPKILPKITNPLLQPYLKKVRKNPPIKNINSDRINITVHVRRGDLVRVVGDKINFLNKKHSHRACDVQDYIKILDKTIKEKGENNCRIFVFSDGNKKALKIFKKKLPPDEYKSILDMDLDSEFKQFLKYKNVEMYIGDNVHLFQKFFYGLTHGDIIICGRSKMIDILQYFKNPLLRQEIIEINKSL